MSSGASNGNRSSGRCKDASGKGSQASGRKLKKTRSHHDDEQPQAVGKKNDCNQEKPKDKSKNRKTEKPNKLLSNSNTHTLVGNRLNNNKDVLEDAHQMYNSAITVECDDIQTVETETTTKPVKNAFSYMMDNRQKVIGSNSPGKDTDKSDELFIQKKHEKEKLVARKALFTKWADSKGAIKRKVEEEELQATIDYKLEKRAKRLKKSLGIEKTDCKTSNDDKVKKESPLHVHCSESISEVNVNLKFQEKVNIKKCTYQTDLSNFFATPDEQTPNLNVETANAKPNNSHKKKIAMIDGNIDSVIDDLTPKAKSKWRMRCRLSLDNADNDLVIPNKIQHEQKNPLKPVNENTSPKLINQKDAGVTKSNSKRKKMKQEEAEYKQSLLSDEENEKVFTRKSLNKQTVKKSLPAVKVAPVFLKVKPDKQTLMARKQFLESGIPDELKRFKEKHDKLLNRITPIFPTISHITAQPSEEEKMFLPNLWNLSCVVLNLQPDATAIPEIGELSLGGLTNCTTSQSIPNTSLKFKKASNIKEDVNKIKKDNPMYPVLKSYKFARDAFCNSCGLERRRSEKKTNSKKHLVRSKLWTDVYKPDSSDLMFSNYTNVRKIKGWLDSRCNLTEKRNKLHKNHESSSEFEGTDGDSRGSSDRPHNALILYGPCGSGKTSAVYAVCEELNIGILESNASSRRTGKILLQQLQQVSQAQELQGIVQDFLSNSCERKTPRKMHLLLIEDVDLVFDQDESFWSAVNQLISTSKLPIILTTTDLNCLHLKKIISTERVLTFVPVTPKVLSPWLQILCLVEGVRVTTAFVSELLQRCNGDVRATLLQLQFLVEGSHKTETICDLITSRNGDKSGLNCSIEGDCAVTKTLDTFGILNLGQIWWNIPQLFNIPHLGDEENTSVVTDADSLVTIETDNNALLKISETFDMLAIVDMLYNKFIDSDLEPVHKNKNCNVKRSLEESLSSDECYFHRDLDVEISHSLFDGCMPGTSSNAIWYNGIDEKRWRAKQYACIETLQSVVPLTHHLDRSASTDYLSSLRCISKSESNRAITNSKRRNRFYSYLSGLGISLNTSMLNTVNKTFLSDTKS